MTDRTNTGRSPDNCSLEKNPKIKNKQMYLFHIGLREGGTMFLHTQDENKQTTGWNGTALGNTVEWVKRASEPFTSSPRIPQQSPLLIFYSKAASWVLGPQTCDSARVQDPGMWIKGGVTRLWRKESLGQGGEQML